MKDISDQIFRKISIPVGELLDLSEDNFIHNSIKISLCSNKRTFSSFRRKDLSGWWADSFTPGDELGSSLFTLARAKQSEETLDVALIYTQEALEWMGKDPDIEVHFEGQDLRICILFNSFEGQKQSRFEVVL